MKITQQIKDDYLNVFGYMKKHNNPNWEYTSKEYQEIIFSHYEKVFLPFEQLTSSQLEALKNINETLQKIDSILEPLRAVNLPYSLSVTGGAIYDFLTLNEDKIKDIDLVLHFPITKRENEEEVKENDGDILCSYKLDDSISEKYNDVIHNLISEHAPNLVQDSKQYNMEHFSHFVQSLINKQFNSPMIYSKANFEKGDYVKALIHSLIKVNDEKLAKPLDIMITQHDETIYCSSFDFNICQNYLTYRSFLNKQPYSLKDLYTSLKENNLEFSAQHMLEKIVCYPGSLKDLSNQTYTMKFNSLRLENIEYYMERHYPRMKEKLPDFKLNFICNNPEYQYIADYYLAQNRFDELDKFVPNKNVEHKQKKKV